MMPLDLEREALASYNYLTNLVEPDTGFTYFDVFMTEPVEAVHDWPDFLDVPGRSAETSVLLRHMTGRPVATEDAFFERILALQREDGLFHRPETRVTRESVMLEEQALVMGALVARAIGDGDVEAESALVRQIEGLVAAPMGEGPFPAMLMRPVARAWEHLESPATGDLAIRLRDALAGESALFREDGSFAGHVHSHLYAAAGLVEMARLTEDDSLLGWMDRVYQVIRSRSTSFGFIPELTERQDDVIACETCCLMDYIHLALSLAQCGRAEYYDDVERAVRNHLVESRVRHGDWLADGPAESDDDLVLRAGVRKKVVGAYAGWSSPNHILAYDEYLPAQWIKESSLTSIYLRKIRALQNCCGPSGPKALYLVWQHAAVVEDGCLRVNLLLDRALPEATVRGFEPHEGRVDVDVSTAMRVALRVPGCTSAADVVLQVNGHEERFNVAGGYMHTRRLAPGDVACFAYPLPERSENVTIGNEGFQEYRYEAEWRGSTVLKMEPQAGPSTGRSHLMAESVPLYYGADGPHPLYQRALDDEPAGTHQALHSTAGPGVW